MAAPTSDSYTAAETGLLRCGYYPSAGGTVTPPTIPTAGVYRTGQQWLLSDVLADTTLALQSNLIVTPAREGIAPPAVGFSWGIFGPSHGYVDQRAQWAWTNPGGDWINTAGAAQALSQPHLSFTADATTSGAAAYTVDATVGVQAARAGDRWNGYILKCVGGVRAVASQHHPTLSPPVISVVYTDGTTGALQCVACVRLTTVSAYTQVGHPEQTILPSVALEFERPTRAVASAQLSITLTQHTPTSAAINGYLINPPTTVPAVVSGIASAYPQDVGLSAAPTVLVSHRYQDGSTLATWVTTPDTGISANLRANWDPEVLGLGAADLTKLPTSFSGNALAGKWFHRQTTFASRTTLVASNYTGDGFAPLAAGLGALRVITPKATDADGATQPQSGSTGADMWMLFPKAICGTDAVRDTYTRFYFRFASSAKRLADTKMYRHTDVSAEYAWQHGKWGIGVHHTTSRGGNNRVGGGTLGWSNRLGYDNVPTDMPNAGLIPFVHSLDNIDVDMYMGNIGGMGAGVYPNRWYCVETRLKLNTYSATGNSPSDGILEVWLDGVKVARHTNWQYRDGPPDPAGGGTDLPPCRELGPTGLWLNEYLGGTFPADEDRVCFYTALACGTSYIGPMAPSTAPTLPSYVPLPGETATLTTSGGGLSNTFCSQMPVWYTMFYGVKIVTDYSGCVSNPYFGTYGSWICEGAGHFSTSNNGVIAIIPGQTSVTFRSLMTGTPIYGNTSEFAFANDTTSDPTTFNGTNWLEYSDGKPASRHSWGAQDVIGPEDGGAAKGTFLRLVVGGAGYNGYNTSPPYSPFIPHKMEFGTDAAGVNFNYARAGTLGPAASINYPYWSAHAKAIGRVYLHTSGSLTVRWFDLATGAYGAGTGTPLTADTDIVAGSVDGALMIGIPERQIVLFLDAKAGALRIRRLPAAASDTNPSWINTPASLSAVVAVNPRWNSAAWVPSINKLIVGTDSDTSAVYEITVPTVLTDTWAVERAPMGSGQSIPFNTAGPISRNFKLWSYLPALKCIAYFPTPDNTGVNDTLYLYRPRGT